MKIIRSQLSLPPANSDASPIDAFHLLMTQVVEYISHRLELEAVYLAPSKQRKFKPQPYNSIGWQELGDRPSIVNDPETQDDDVRTVTLEAPDQNQTGLETPAEERPLKPQPWTYGEYDTTLISPD